MSRNLFFLVLPVLLSGCLGQNQKSEIEKPFEHTLDFELEIQRLSSEEAVLYKQVMTDGKLDEVKRVPDSTGWAKELQSFINAAEFNAVSNKDEYELSVEEHPVSRLTEYRYTALDSSETVKEAVFVHRDGTVEEARFTVGQDNPAYSFSRRLTYRPRTGFEIISKLKIIGFVAEDFTVKGVLKTEEMPLTLRFNIGEETLPVRSFLRKDEIDIVNGSDRITLNFSRKDSRLKADFPVFDSELRFTRSEERIHGTWHNYDRGEDYEIAFESKPAFIEGEPGGTDVSGKFETHFIHEGDTNRAVGVLEQIGTRLFGTFMTETGDYRHLEGVVRGDSFTLSTFDGAFAYLFRGVFHGSDRYEGTFYSGYHFQARFEGRRNPDAQLADADSLTFFNPGYSRLDFRFKDTAGEYVSLRDERFAGKPVLVTVMGTWCPNCKDEALFLKELYGKYGGDLEIVALAFERSSDFEKSKEAVQRAVRDLELPYEMLITEHTPEEAGEALPELNHVMSFPTLIVLDKNREVRKIHTGFKGPATGKPYDEFKKEMNQLVRQLISE